MSEYYKIRIANLEHGIEELFRVLQNGAELRFIENAGIVRLLKYHGGKVDAESGLELIEKLSEG